MLISRPSEELIIEETTAFTIINSDNLGSFGKPNAIVRPVRRVDPSEGQPNLENIESQIVGSNKKVEFNKELEKKLRKLQKHEIQIIQPKRPLFITTVPKGIFLQPDCNQPIQPRKVYAYVSRPRILHNSGAYNYETTDNKSKIVSKIANGLNSIAGGISVIGFNKLR